MCYQESSDLKVMNVSKGKGGLKGSQFFKYLGSLVRDTNSTTEDIKAKNAPGNGTYFAT